MSATWRLEAADTQARRAELAALAGIIWHEHYVPIIGRAQVDYMLARGYSETALAAEQAAGTRFTLVYAEDAEAIGYMAVSPPDSASPQRAWLDKLYVAAAARGLGVGRRLVQHAAEQADHIWSARELALRVNRHNAQSIAAYRRLGFIVERADIKDIGGGFVMDDYLMAADVADLLAGEA